MTRIIISRYEGRVTWQLPSGWQLETVDIDTSMDIGHIEIRVGKWLYAMAYKKGAFYEPIPFHMSAPKLMPVQSLGEENVRRGKAEGKTGDRRISQAD